MPLTSTDNSAMTVAEKKFVQTRLMYHGFDCKWVDGIFGPLTNSCIIAFKKSLGMWGRPYVGPLTWEALAAGRDGTIDTPSDVAMLPWIEVGKRFLGMHEVNQNAELTEFMSSDGRYLGDPSQFPWCGDFVQTCIALSLPDEVLEGQLAKNPYWALNWQLFGEACEPRPGCVASISRSGGGHVGFIIGEDAARYYVLGGNQSDKVSIAPITKSRFTKSSFRWPKTYDWPGYSMPQYASTADAEINFA